MCALRLALAVSLLLGCSGSSESGHPVALHGVTYGGPCVDRLEGAGGLPFRALRLELTVPESGAPTVERVEGSQHVEG